MIFAITTQDRCSKLKVRFQRRSSKHQNVLWPSEMFRYVYNWNICFQTYSPDVLAHLRIWPKINVTSLVTWLHGFTHVIYYIIYFINFSNDYPRRLSFFARYGQMFEFMTMYLQMPSAKRQPFCPGGNELNPELYLKTWLRSCFWNNIKCKWYLSGDLRIPNSTTDWESIERLRCAIQKTKAMTSCL